jgi:hypothetical protein
LIVEKTLDFGSEIKQKSSSNLLKVSVQTDDILFLQNSSNKKLFLRISAINNFKTLANQRLPGACNRSPGSKLLSITTQLHCGGHLGGRARLPDTILEEDHPMTIPSKFGSN